MRINYFHIEWFSKTDGPGCRTVLFLQGCNLRCPWCHSPHSREAVSKILFNPIRCLKCYKCINICKNGVHVIANGTHMLQRDKCIKCGKCIEACPTSGLDLESGALILPTRSIDTMELFNLLWPQLEVLKNSGGLTISGGEALLQKEAVLEILKYCKSKGVHTAIETSLGLPVESYKLVSKYVDCWLIGIRSVYLKDKADNMDEETMKNIQFISSLGKEVIVRFPVIKGYTQSETQIAKLVEYMNIGNFNNIEVLPCNQNMSHYYTLLGTKPEINVKEALVSKTEINSIVSFFKAKGLNVRTMT